MVTRPLQLVAIMVSQSSSGASCAGSVPSARPALLISTSICCQSAGSTASAASIDALLVTSSVTGSSGVAQFGGQSVEAIGAAGRR